MAISNKIRALKDRGIKTTAKIEGVCASVSTCIACACDKIVMSKGSFFMIHNCWSVVEGDCNTLRKEADLMEKMNEAILSFYRSKFNATDEQLKQWMNEETWISSDDVGDFGLICEIDDNEVEFKIAASINRYDFKHIPRGLKKMEEKTIEKIEKTGDETLETLKEEVIKEEPVEQVEKKVEEPIEEPIEEHIEEQKKEDEDEVLTNDEALEKLSEYEKKIKELTKENEELKSKLAEMETPDEEKVTKKECEKRVSGMQASMQKQINEHLNQIKAKDEEIRTVRAELSSLTSKLEEATKELTAKSSALVEKENALAMLNAGVNAPSEELPTMNDGLARCATPAEKVAFLKAGKFVRRVGE